MSCLLDGPGIWIVRELQQLFDGPILLVFTLLTQLGDVSLLFLRASIVYVTVGHVRDVECIVSTVAVYDTERL